MRTDLYQDLLLIVSRFSQALHHLDEDRQKCAALEALSDVKLIIITAEAEANAELYCRAVAYAAKFAIYAGEREQAKFFLTAAKAHFRKVKKEYQKSCRKLITNVINLIFPY